MDEDKGANRTAELDDMASVLRGSGRRAVAALVAQYLEGAPAMTMAASQVSETGRADRENACRGALLLMYVPFPPLSDVSCIFTLNRLESRPD